jgi:spore maturation protein CgeB
LEEFFVPDEEIVTYTNHHEAKDKARYLLANPTKAKDIARKGMNKAWKNHSSSIRAKQFAEILYQNV